MLLVSIIASKTPGPYLHALVSEEVSADQGYERAEANLKAALRN